MVIIYKMGLLAEGAAGDKLFILEKYSQNKNILRLHNLPG